MAIYHFSAKVIGRSQGRSAVAAAAYRSASELLDEHLDRTHDYTAKADVVHSEILLPEGAPARWDAGEDASAEERRVVRERLWNEVEAAEKRRDAQLARDIEIALPRELTRAEAIALARDFVREQFVSCGMVADLNVHWGVRADGEAQPHAHVMLTMRDIVPGREGHPEEARFGKKVVAWNDRALLRGWRERWAEMANARLAELGHDMRIDHRSYAEQGIPLEPQHKVGPAGARRAERGEDAERRAEHDGIARRNGERIAADPVVALDALTRQHSTFTRADLARFVNRHTDGAEQFGTVMARVEAAPELVRLGVDGRGRDRFSTREMVAAEQRMEGAAAELAAPRSHRVGVVEVSRAVRRAEADGLALGEEQRAAVFHVAAGRDLALVVGYAGTGKSATLGVARQAWEAAGLRVRGAALSGIAAEGLEGGSGIESRTLASLEWGWKEGRDALTARDVLVVDEAGMVGSRQMERVLSAAQRAGAKVVLVGDPEQLQAIEAGAAFRALAERHGAAEIGAVRRQREGWQRDATRELATGRTGAALGRYEQAGMVRGHATQEEARAALVEGWDTERRAAPEQSRVMLAYTRSDVAELNRLAREQVRAAGGLGPDQVVQTERGERAMAAGDRLMFLRNERGLGAGPGGRGGAAVKNGSLGTVLAVEAGGERLTVRLDGPGGPAGAGQEGKDTRPVVTFYVRDYAHVDHGYAATVHKAQGVTVDRAHVLASAHMDRHAAYVALTRHREGVALHWSAAELGDRAGLGRTLGRERAKDTSLDYGGPERAYAERRGLDPLRPESEIVVRQAARAEPKPPTPAAGLDIPATAVPEQAAPRRGRFAGLRLGAGGGAFRAIPEPVPELAPAPVAQPEPARAEGRGERLARGLAGYARAWEDRARMEQAGLPVLPHQDTALARAGAVLEAEGVNMARDAATVLARDPSLAGLTAGGQAEGVAVFGRAVGEARRGRLALEERGRAAVWAWDTLEQAHDLAAGRYEWEAARAATGEMEAFARALKQDAALDGLLRERGGELGVAEGSRLARVAALDGAAVERELARELQLEQAPRQSRGMSMGM
jgi:Ti-type conjugative transfer relaxase TraA